MLTHRDGAEALFLCYLDTILSSSSFLWAVLRGIRRAQEARLPRRFGRREGAKEANSFTAACKRQGSAPTARKTAILRQSRHFSLSVNTELPIRP
jgi:hypothetical protein